MKKTNFTRAEAAAIEIAAAEVVAENFTYEPVYTFVYMGKAYAFSFESIKACAGEPAYTAVVEV